VNPGFESQAFIPEVLPKIRRLKQMIDKSKFDVEIEVDGGINADNLHQVSEAGAEVFVAGSAIFYSKDYAATIRLMREKMVKS
jgi:ribulose-phosphate 3-epimerase